MRRRLVCRPIPARIYRECDEKRWSFLVIYHSHTASEAYPSPTDIRLAFWPEAYYALVSLERPDEPVVRAFRILDGIDDVHFSNLTSADVVRHRLVGNIVDAYERWDASQQDHRPANGAPVRSSRPRRQGS